MNWKQAFELWKLLGLDGYNAISHNSWAVIIELDKKVELE